MNAQKISETLTKLFLSCIAATSAIHGLMGLSVGLVVLDLILSLLAAKKLGQQFDAYGKGKQMLVRTGTYLFAIVFCFVIDKNFNVGVELVKVAGAFIGLQETQRVFKNLATVTGIDFLQVISPKLQPPKDEEPPR